MGKLLARIVPLGTCLVLAAALGPALGLSLSEGRASQIATTVDVDADPTGNTATSVGEIDPCVSVQAGQSFDVDIVVTDVVDLLAWQTMFDYDRSVVQVTKADMNLFIAGTDPTRTLNLSDTTPDTDGIFSIAVVDTTPGGEGHTSTGVLARITLHAVGTGSSFLTVNDTILADIQSNPIGDVTGDDEFFDGTVRQAQVWVDQPCPGVLPTPTPGPSPTVSPETTPGPSPTVGPETTPAGATPSPAAPTTEPGEPTPAPSAVPSQPPGADNDDDNGFPWAVVGGAGAAAIVAALAVSLAFRWLVRRA